MKLRRYLARFLKGEQKTREDKRLMKNSPWVGNYERTKLPKDILGRDNTKDDLGKHLVLAFFVSKAFHFVLQCYNSHSMSGVIWRKE